MPTDEVLKQRFKAKVEQDYEPVFEMDGRGPSALEMRKVQALEYIAYQLGKIRQSLEKNQA